MGGDFTPTRVTADAFHHVSAELDARALASHFTAGSRVALVNLAKRPELNGQEGTVVGGLQGGTQIVRAAACSAGCYM